MDQKPLQATATGHADGVVEQLALKLKEYGQNASQNLSQTFEDMSMQHWIRVIMIIGGYMLLRPYLMKAVTSGAVKKMEEDDAREKEEEAKMSPNDLRGVKEQLELQDDEDQSGDGTSTDWGQKARVRQRVILKQMLEAEERRREEEEDDKDIEEFLED